MEIQSKEGGMVDVFSIVYMFFIAVYSCRRDLTGDKLSAYEKILSETGGIIYHS